MPVQKGSSRPSGRAVANPPVEIERTPIPVARHTAPQSLPERPLTNYIRPGASPKRIEQRTIRRQGARQTIDQTQPKRPRTIVRLVSHPTQVMPRMPVPKGSFQLTLPVADNWLKMIGRARSEGYVQGRSVSISDEELERVRNASQQCSNCHAAVTAPILWGRLKLGVNIVV